MIVIQLAHFLFHHFSEIMQGGGCFLNIFDNQLLIGRIRFSVYTGDDRHSFSVKIPIRSAEFISHHQIDLSPSLFGVAKNTWEADSRSGIAKGFEIIALGTHEVFIIQKQQGLTERISFFNKLSASERLWLVLKPNRNSRGIAKRLIKGWALKCCL